ncbi:MAG: glycoside hydrolase family 127 protein [Thermomicrobiales bacterium]
MISSSISEESLPLRSGGNGAFVVDTSHSPFARLRPVAIQSVRLSGGLLAERIRTNRDVTIPSQFGKMEESGRIDNFRRASGKIDGPFQGVYYNDSDLYKLLEAAAWALADGPNDALSAMLEAAITEIADAQDEDGYLNTYFSVDRVGERWTNHDLHEMYCGGHLSLAAIALQRITGESRLLEVATRFADHICERFGPEEAGKRFGIDGHEGAEVGMVELGRATGNPRYIEEAQYFVDARGYGRLPKPYGGWFGKEYHQDHVPLRDAQRMAGHVVRGTLYVAGAADVYLEQGDPTLLTALERLWSNMVSKQMYISGALGSRHQGEAFGDDYELPNARAYAETCGAIGGMLWTWRMFSINGDGQYIDTVENMLFNAILPGVSLEGDTYFYQNPLADDGHHRRQPWFGTACCPPNVARILAALPGYLYSVSEDAIWVNIYSSGSAAIPLPDGRTIELRQETRYPWDGDIAFDVQTEGEFALRLRIPGWCESGASLQVNGEDVDTPIQSGSYVEIRRMWKQGDTVRLHLPMPVRRMESHPNVTENTGRVALARGPLLYCLEGIDLNGAHPNEVIVPASATINAIERPDLLGGITTLEIEAEIDTTGTNWTDRLYQSDPERNVPLQGSITAIPYYAWANRESGPMQVWLRTS